MNDITLQDVLDAIEEDGLPKAFGSYFWGHESKPTGACAFGQAFINLNKKGANLRTPGDLRWSVDKINSKLASEIIRLNDHTDLSVKEVGIAIKNKYSPSYLKRKVFKDII